MKHASSLSILLLAAMPFALALNGNDGSALIGKAAPDFTLQRYGGGRLSLASLHGSVVLVAFWIPSVPECKEVMPMLQGLYNRQHARGLEIVGVDMKGNKKAAENFRDRAEITFPIVKGDAKMAMEQWSVNYTPSYYLVDRAGIVVHYYSPNEAREIDRIERDIISILNK